MLLRFARFTEIRGMRYCASAKGTCEFAGMNVHRDFNAAYSIAGEAYRRIRGMDVQAYMQRPSHAKEDAKHLLAVGGKYKRIKHVTAKEHLTKPVYRLGKNASVFQQLGEYDDDDDDDGGDGDGSDAAPSDSGLRKRARPQLLVAGADLGAMNRRRARARASRVLQARGLV